LNTEKLLNAEASARPSIELREDGVLIRRVALGAAEQLVARGWACWIGKGRRRHLALTESAPLSALPGWHGRDGTQPLQADQTCLHYDDRQLMGDPARLREFKRV
jgi:hypothetical protein